MLNIKQWITKLIEIMINVLVHNYNYYKNLIVNKITNFVSFKMELLTVVLIVSSEIQL
jgi:hypothetical protein